MRVEEQEALNVAKAHVYEMLVFMQLRGFYNEAPLPMIRNWLARLSSSTPSASPAAVSRRCTCGECGWPPDTMKIEDSRGALHYADSPCLAPASPAAGAGEGNE